MQLLAASVTTPAFLPRDRRRRFATCSVRHVGRFDGAAPLLLVVLLEGAQIAAVRVELPRDDVVAGDAVATALPVEAVLSFIAARAGHDAAATKEDDNG